MYMYSLNKMFSSGLTILPARAKDHLTKTLTKYKKASFELFGQGCPRDLQSITDYCYFPWMPSMGGR